MLKTVFYYLAVLLCLVPVSRADDDVQTEGTSAEEVAKLKARPLPAPNTLKVAVLPFWDTTGSVEHVRMATAANWLLWQREGFVMLPILDGFKALESDGKVEPGMALRREDATRIGKAMGADWVVYGEVRELDVFKKRSIFKESKNINAALRIAVAEVEPDTLAYWQLRRDKKGGTGLAKGFQSKMDQLKRHAVVIVSLDATRPLFEAFPAHTITGKVPESGDLAGFIDRTWPDKK